MNSSGRLAGRAKHFAFGAIMLAALATKLMADEAASPACARGQCHRTRPVARIPHTMQAPSYPEIDNVPEPTPDANLADAIARAYRSNPTLQAARYDLRAIDENLGLALSELRPSSELQITGQYNKSVPGEVAQASRQAASFGAPISPIITSNSLAANLIIKQPLYTGGKASADVATAKAAIRAGRAGLRSTEGDVLLRTITAYVDVRRSTRDLAIRITDLRQLKATLEEVRARREAGELTKTDIANTETQVNNAEANVNITRAQLELDRADYTSLVGVDPGNLAPEPQLPQIPASVDEAIDIATRLNPDLARARYVEFSSREKIASARAANHPTFALQATATLTGQAAPLYLRNEDQDFGVRGVLTIPLTSGGHNGAAITQAEDTNSGDRLRIEAARRSMLLSLASAWNQITQARRNVAVVDSEVKSGRIFYEGSFAEYRAGLRSTFDVLYAQGTLLNAQLALVAAKHDLYIAEATLLRYVGLLEVRDLTTGIGLYNVSADIHHIENRGAVPWDQHIRALDRISKASNRTRVIQQPPALSEPAKLAPVVGPSQRDDYMTSSAGLPEPGTVGRQVSDGMR